MGDRLFRCLKGFKSFDNGFLHNRLVTCYVFAFLYIGKKSTGMHIIELKISDKVYEKFIWLLSKFSKEEVEVISENQDFNSDKTYLQAELDQINTGEASFVSQDDFEKRLNKII